MSRRDDFQKSMERNLAGWGARLATLKAGLRGESPAAGDAADVTRLADLQAAGDAATSQLEALKATSGDPWDVRKLEMARAWHDLDSIMKLMEKEMAER